MAQTLVQALEGINFPCNRARIVEYARQHDIAPRAMEFLNQLPDQQYRDMTELFRALPSKSSRSARPAVSPQPRQQAEEQRVTEQQAAAEAQQGEEDEVQQAWMEDEAAPPTAEQWAAMPGLPQSAFDLGAGQLCRMSLQWQQLWLEGLNKSLQLYGQAWSAWTRR